MADFFRAKLIKDVRDRIRIKRFLSSGGGSIGSALTIVNDEARLEGQARDTTKDTVGDYFIYRHANGPP